VITASTGDSGRRLLPRANFLTSATTPTQTVNGTPTAEGLADPARNPLMAALSDTIKGSSGTKIIRSEPPAP
jgi:hypothetical protein